MTRVSNLAVALGAALALGACAGEGGQLATSPEAPAFQTGGVGPACNLTDLRKATSALFGTRDPANDIAKKFSNKNQNTAAVTPFAYQLFEAIEAKRNDGTWAATDPAKGAELTLQIIACSDVVYTDASLQGTNTANARDAFTAALDDGSGMYAVGEGSETAILSKNEEAGLRAPSDFGTWFGGNKTLVIGYSITPTGFSTEDEAGTYYEWSMVRPAGSSPLSGLATISLCVGNSTAFTDPELRIQHLPSGQGGTILPLPTAGDVPGVFCNPLAGLDAERSGSFAARLVRGLLDIVRPAPLHAVTFKMGPVSGTLGDFSPTGVVDPDTTFITFTQVPTGGKTNTDLRVEVLVTGEGGTPWAGITVKLTASDNNGATLAPCNTEAVTNDDGLAIFEHFQINSPGIVHLTAETIETLEGLGEGVGAYDEVSLESSSFVVTGAGNQACTEL